MEIRPHLTFDEVQNLVARRREIDLALSGRAIFPADIAAMGFRQCPRDRFRLAVEVRQPGDLYLSPDESLAIAYQERGEADNVPSAFVYFSHSPRGMKEFAYLTMLGEYTDLGTMLVDIARHRTGF